MKQMASDVELTPLGLEALALCVDDEPSASVRRLFASVLMLRNPPAWVAYWQGDPESLELIIPSTEKEVLSGAGLFPRDKDGNLLARAWWSALEVVPVPEEIQAQRKVTGDAGEELSFRFEKDRLTREGYPELASQVCWVGRESPAYGFDIASFAGATIRSTAPTAPLAIEVKSVAYPARVRFPLHLTIHEWTMACELGSSHIFHLWDRVRPPPSLGAKSTSPRLVLADHLRPHIAGSADCGERCKWESVYIELPLGKAV